MARPLAGSPQPRGARGAGRGGAAPPRRGSSQPPGGGRAGLPGAWDLQSRPSSSRRSSSMPRWWASSWIAAAVAGRSPRSLWTWPSSSASAPASGEPSSQPWWSRVA